MGMPRRCACQAARVMLPAFSLPSETKTILGTRPDGSELMASSILDSRSVARPASPAVGCRCRPCSARQRDRVRIGQTGRTRTQWRPRALSRASAKSEARARSCGEMLEEVSTRTATAIFVCGDGERGFGQGQNDGEKRQRLQNQRGDAAGPPPLEEHPAERQEQKDQDPGSLEDHDAFLQRSHWSATPFAARMRRSTRPNRIQSASKPAAPASASQCQRSREVGPKGARPGSPSFTPWRIPRQTASRPCRRAAAG